MAINYEWVLEQLNTFVKMCEREKFLVPPSEHPRYRFLIPDDDIAKQASVVRLALETIFPGQRFGQNYGRFQTQMLALREPVIDAIPQIERMDEIDANLGLGDDGPVIAADSLHPWVWDAARPHWESGNHRAALLNAATNVNSRLRKKLGRTNVSDQAAIRQSFSTEPPEPERPRLRLVPEDDPDNFKSVHVGVMNFGCGLFGAVRNPVAHLSDADHDIDEREALESLAAFSLLARWIDRAQVVKMESLAADEGRVSVRVPAQA